MKCDKNMVLALVSTVAAIFCIAWMNERINPPEKMIYLMIKKLDDKVMDYRKEILDFKFDVDTQLSHNAFCDVLIKGLEEDAEKDSE